MSGLGAWKSGYLLNDTLDDTTSRRSGEKNASMTRNDGGRSQFYFYTIYRVFISVHMLHLGKWHPGVMAKTFVCQCCVTLE